MMFKRKLLMIVMLVIASALCSGCGIFGCGFGAANGGAIGGCHAGMRF